MSIRTFRAENLQAALKQIRDELGADATILETRQVREGFWGCFGRLSVEVTASVCEKPDYFFISEPRDSKSSTARETARQQNPSLKSLNLNHPLQRCKQHLLASGVALDQVEQWIERVAINEDISHVDVVRESDSVSRLREVVADSLRLDGGIALPTKNRYVVALVGPTGVGKTTTTAKIAASFRLQGKCDVGLLTTDTFRVGGVNQLSRYSALMGIPMEIAETPEDMLLALERLNHVDLVLIDTCGRSPRSQTSLNDLNLLLRAASPNETHLVLSSTASMSSLRLAYDGFASLDLTHLLLTKVDEACHAGGVIANLTGPKSWTDLPLGYLTDGQCVPDDIVSATPQSVGAFILPESESKQLSATG